MASNSTKEKILHVAERLFADHGLDGTSLRMITREADVNLAAVNYHFGSKEGLIGSAFRRWVLPINAARLRRLSDLESTFGGDALTVEQIMEAFISPIFEVPHTSLQERTLFLRLIGRLYTEPAETIRNLYLQDVTEVARRYVAAFRRVLPEVPEKEILWRLHFTIGMLSHALLTTGFLKGFMSLDLDTRDCEKLKQRLIGFACAGLRAAAPPNGQPVDTPIEQMELTANERQG